MVYPNTDVVPVRKIHVRFQESTWRTFFFGFVFCLFICLFYLFGRGRGSGIGKLKFCEQGYLMIASFLYCFLPLFYIVINSLSWFGEMKKGRYRGSFFSINGWKIEFHPHDLINDKRERSSHKCLSIDMYYLHHACVSRHEEREESHVFPPSMDDPHANGLKCTLIRCTEHLLKVRFIIPVNNTNPPRF